MWRRWAARDPEQAGLFVLPLSPDRVHKENVSGGAPYGLILPDGCADGLFASEIMMPFVSYLNHVFSHGGFPGQTLPDNHWHRKQALAKDLLPFESRTQSGTEVTVTASSPSAPGTRHVRATALRAAMHKSSASPSCLGFIAWNCKTVSI